MLKALRQPRYAALSVLMVIVATICVLAGTWQIARLHTKATENAELRRNAHAPTATVASVLPMVGRDPKPSAHKIQFRTVTATGTYEAERTTLVRHRSVDSVTGYLVVTPFRTADGTLLVVRGFISSAGTAAVPTAPASPTGRLTITAHAKPAETKTDLAASLDHNQVESINPGDQAARLGEPVFNGYGELVAGQPGTGQLTAIPKPDLSNPAGGAIEPQHLAYIIQWYLFALLALAAPIAMVRAETRERIGPERDLDMDPHVDADVDQDVDHAAPSASSTEPSAQQVRAAKLADRYGRSVR